MRHASRPARIHPDGVPQHIVNRGNLATQIFLSNPRTTWGFLAAMADAADRTAVRLLAFCLMPNHWHLVLWPYNGQEISAYMQVLMNAHIRDLQRRHHSAGTGHIYQSRFRNHPILDEGHFLNVCRYVEANARTAGLVPRAEEWRWSSLTTRGPDDEIDLLADWPVRAPPAGSIWSTDRKPHRPSGHRRALRVR